ncbi:MAG: hypothetical protein PSX80_11135 [bacterium]|nr:hypothetical protein [bacterium]
MKLFKIASVVFSLMLLVASTAQAQQQFTHTVTSKNKYCNSTCTILDIPGLNDNPSAIIIVKPVSRGGISNPHPVGVYYTDPKRWSIINLDGVAITEGAIFSIEYYPNPTPEQFVYVIPKQGVTPCINHPGLDGHPNAQIRFSATQSPRGAYFNREEIKIAYEAAARKWCIANLNNQPVSPDTAYNIVIDSSGLRISDLTKLPDQNPKLPTQNPTLPLATPIDAQITGNIPKSTDLAKQPVPPASQNPLWVLNGTNIANNNLGNVGIGTNTPNAPLGFAPVLGKKITLYPGATGDVGFGVQGNLLQIYSDNPQADIAMGYDQAGTFKEKFRVQANGAIAFSENTGQSGQVLMSNGAGSPPTWKSFSNPVIAFSNPKKTAVQGGFLNANGDKNMLEMEIDLVLTKKSVVSFTGLIDFWYFPCVGLTDCKRYTSMWLLIRANGVGQHDKWYIDFKEHDTQLNYNINNFMFPLNAGTYKIDVIVTHMSGTYKIGVSPRYASIIAYPIEP